jgi:hypothetical protein
MYNVPRISVRTLYPISEEKWAYLVKIIKSDGSGTCTSHKVMLDKPYYKDLSNGEIMPEEFVKKAIEFILRNQDKDHLEDKFDIVEITRSFPDFNSYMRRQTH